MDNNIHRIDGFIDRGSLQVGSPMKYVDKDGLMRQTSPITHVEVAGGKVYAETQSGSIYVNYDIEHSQQQQSHEDRPQYENDEVKMFKNSLAQYCIDADKHPKEIGNFDINQLTAEYSDGQFYQIDPSQVTPGMHIHLPCDITDLETNQTMHGVLNVPNVQNFQYENGTMIIESGSSLFANVDFSKEFAEKSFELSQNFDLER